MNRLLMYTNTIAGWTVKVSRGESVASSAGTAGMQMDIEDGSLTTLAAGADLTEDADGDATTVRLSGTAAVEGHDAVMSYATKGSFMGATIAAGLSQIDMNGSSADTDPNFVTVSYSLAGMDLGYAVYDNDAGSEETQMGIGTTMAGMSVGVGFYDLDAATDSDKMRVSVSKGMGAASFGLDYTETDVAGTDTGDSDEWNFMYVVGF